jgi:hypothetical protein
MSNVNLAKNRIPIVREAEKEMPNEIGISKKSNCVASKTLAHNASHRIEDHFEHGFGT